jgi:hypothetical protein
MLKPARFGRHMRNGEIFPFRHGGELKEEKNSPQKFLCIVSDERMINSQV